MQTTSLGDRSYTPLQLASLAAGGIILGRKCTQGLMAITFLTGSKIASICKKTTLARALQREGNQYLFSAKTNLERDLIVAASLVTMSYLFRKNNDQNIGARQPARTVTNVVKTQPINKLASESHETKNIVLPKAKSFQPESETDEFTQLFYYLSKTSRLEKVAEYYLPVKETIEGKIASINDYITGQPPTFTLKDLDQLYSLQINQTMTKIKSTPLSLDDLLKPIKTYETMAEQSIQHFSEQTIETLGNMIKKTSQQALRSIGTTIHYICLMPESVADSLEKMSSNTRDIANGLLGSMNKQFCSVKEFVAPYGNRMGTFIDSKANAATLATWEFFEKVFY